MTTYYEMKNAIVKFLNESNISAYDLVRIGKDLCCCRTCVHFVQHYSKDGEAFDFGHCIRHRKPSATRPSSASCGSWCLERDEEES